MGEIYKLTFFFALGLLAIVIAIFVFAVSLLGRAMETAAQDEKNKISDRRAKNAEAIEAIKKEMIPQELSGKIPRELTRRLEKLQKQDDKFEKELGKIRRAPELLTAKGGVFYTCAFFLLP